MKRRLSLLVIVLAFAGIAPAGETIAQEPARSWTEEKCVRYSAAWSDALSRLGNEGLGEQFLDDHEAFLASGCSYGIRVCPRSPEELRLADVMIISAMNAGMASTFPPFACGG